MHDYLPYLSQLSSRLPLGAFASFAAFATFACSVAGSSRPDPRAVPAFLLVHGHGAQGKRGGHESAGTPAMRRHGFAVNDEGLKEQFEECARFGGGRFFDAAGAVIGSGVVAGDATRAPPGTYTVEV